MTFFTYNGSANNFFVKHLAAAGALIDDPEKADFLVLPFNYELIYDYAPAEFLRWGLDPTIKHQLKEEFNSLENLSITLKKKLIVFFYRDTLAPINLKNAIIFRTSYVKSGGDADVYGMPAFIEHKPANKDILIRKKTEKPRLFLYQ